MKYIVTLLLSSLSLLILSLKSCSQPGNNFNNGKNTIVGNKNNLDQHVFDSIHHIQDSLDSIVSFNFKRQAIKDSLIEKKKLDQLDRSIYRHLQTRDAADMDYVKLKAFANKEDLDKLSGIAVAATENTKDTCSLYYWDFLYDIQWALVIRHRPTGDYTKRVYGDQLRIQKQYRVCGPIPFGSNELIGKEVAQTIVVDGFVWDEILAYKTLTGEVVQYP